jgi:hypothetical protein
LSPDQILALARQSTSNKYTAPPETESPDVFYHEPSRGETSSGSFTRLAADVYLPFIDRSAEVFALISNPPLAKLLSLLAQTFPRSDGHLSPSLMATASAPPQKKDISEFPEDSATWTFEQLFLWLTSVPRAVAPDELWIHRIRACIYERSELIWERIKGALGVPPELDVDDRKDGRQDIFDESEATAASMVDFQLTLTDKEETQEFVSSPIYDCDFESSSPRLSIENIIATSTPPMTSSGSHPANPPPLSLPSSLGATHMQPLSHSPLIPEAGLENISEDQEETEDDINAPNNVSPEQRTDQEDHTTAKPTDEPMLPGAIQGLKISTLPVHHSPTSSPSPRHRAHSFTSSPSRHTISLPHDSSTHAFSSSMCHKSPRSSSFGSSPSNASVPYDPVGDRVPGNPLFPSSFAQLAVGPTSRTK